MFLAGEQRSGRITPGPVHSVDPLVHQVPADECGSSRGPHCWARVPVEEPGFGRWHTFDGYRGDLLCDRQAFGNTARKKLEERVDDRAAVIARALVLVMRDLEMVQETQYAIERDLCQTTGYIARDEGEEQPQG